MESVITATARRIRRRRRITVALAAANGIALIAGGHVQTARAAAPAPTQTSLGSAPNPSSFGHAVTFTATVFPTGGSVPTGSVSFDEEVAGVISSHLGTATVTAAGANGSAAFTTGSLAVGSHDVVATYGGDSSNLTSVSSMVIQTVSQASTATALSSSKNPSTLGDSVTLTATVTSGGGTPTGTVTFDEGGGFLGAGSLDNTGTATFSTTGLSLGSHSLTAVYGGDGNFTTSTSAAVSQVVKAASSTSLVAAPNPSSFGATVTLTATVTGSNGTPTGTVTFKNGTTSLGSPATLDGTGKAVVTTAALTTGGHSLTAVYGGDSGYSPSTSSAVTQGVQQATPTVVLTPSANPSPFGSSLTLTTTVSGPVNATATPTGTVTVKDGTTVIGSSSLVSGSATVQTSTLAVGSHSLTSVYAGDTNYAATTSSAVGETVSRSATSTTLGASPSPGISGQAVTLTATITGSGGTPTGTVTFKDGSTVLGSPVNLGSGTATLTTSALVAGTHSLTAVYSGDGTYLTSTSAGTSETVLALTTTTLSSSTTSPVVGQTVSITATVSGSGGTPSGSVTFRDGSTALGSPVTMTGGTATLTTSALALGSHSITAVYGGDATFNGSTSASLGETVGQAATTTALSSSANPTAAGPLTYTATVSAVAPGAGTATGSVAFTDGGVTIPGCDARALSSAVATCTVSYTAAGSHSIAAVYSGNTDFTGSSGTLTQSITGPGGVTVTLHSHALAANGTATTQVSAQLTDSQGSPLALAGDTVTFTSDGGLGFTDSSGNPTTSAVTDASGLATVKVVASTHAGTVVITATTSDTPALTSSDHLKLTGSRFAQVALSQSAIAANGASTTTATARVVDGSGAPVSSEVVSFSSSGATIAQPLVLTDANGNATDTVTSSTTPGTLPVTVSDGNFAANPTSILVLTLLPAAAADNSSFIHNSYVTMLGRDVDPPSYGYWLGRLNSGTLRSVLASSLATSDEYRRDVIGGTLTIQGFYLEYLGRPSDPGGVAYWDARMAHGITFEQVRLAFIGSPEYFIHHSSDPSQTIDALYNDVLGRSDASDPAGKAYWLTHFNVNTIAAQFLYSSEGRAHLVDSYYSSILHRGPDAGGLSYWTTAILSGASDENVIADFLSSQEYFLSH